MKWLQKLTLPIWRLRAELAQAVSERDSLRGEIESKDLMIDLLSHDLTAARARCLSFQTTTLEQDTKIDGLVEELRTVRNQLITQRAVAQNVTVPSDQEHSFAERYAYLRNNFTMHNIRRAGRDADFKEGDYTGMNFQWSIHRWDPKDPTPEQLDRRLDEQIERHKSMLKDKTRERK